MKREIISLDILPMNKKAYIENLNCEGDIRRRLLDLGLVKGTKIEPVLISPSKDPRAFQVKGSIIAIRKESAQFIFVTM